VDFELSDDQLALGAAAGELLDGLASRERVRAVVDGGGGYDRELWKAMAEQGWTAVEVPEKEGGLGLGLVEVAVLAEQLGRRAAPAPFVESVLALGAIAAAGTGTSQEVQELFARLASGDAIGCVSCGPSSPEVPGLHAQSTAGGWSLSGRAGPVLYSPVADVAVVAARHDGSEALYAVPLEARHPRAESAMDRTRCLGWLELDRAPAHRLGDDRAVLGLLDRAAAAASAEMLGGASRVLDMTVEYAKQRVQFGRPIGSFQAVKHRCADMLVDVEGMWSAAYYAAWAVGAQHRDASLAASTAKTWCSDASRRVMASGLQVHGGIGFTWEHDLHLYMKRAQLDQVSFGDAAFHRERLAGLLRSRVERGESVF
jgi:alkylation response protein AidB-like acyl-CoA dehydrogenase